MNNIMLDIETLSTRSNAIITSIGAVKFSFGSTEIETFTVNIDPKSCKQYGLHVDPETIEWWKKQSPSAIKAFMTNQQPLDTALDLFTDWIGSNWKDTIYWANGSQFDHSILQWSYLSCGKSVPWKHWNLRDARTVYAICDFDLKTIPRIGTYHNAIDDCLTQIEGLRICLS